MSVIRPNPNNITVGSVVGGILSIRDEITNPSPGNPTGGIGRAVCRAVASTGFDQIPLNNRTGVGFVCEDYWEDEAIDPPQDVVPFEGGQCPGVLYDIFYNRTENPLASDADVRRPGPIIGLVNETGENSSGQQGTFTFLVTDGGAQRNQISFVPDGSALRGWFIRNVERVDGQPDDCGDPPGTSEPGPSNPGTPFGDPFPLPGFPDVTVTVNPPEGGDGPEFYIPITFENDDGEPVGPPIFWRPDGIPPDIPVPPVPPAAPGTPAEPMDPSGDIPDDITPEEEERVDTIGYEWELTGLPDNLSLVPGTSPAVLTTPYGNVQLRFEDSTGATRYSDNLPIRVVSGSIVRQDPSLVVKGVLYSRRPDVGGIRLTPLRAERR